MHEGSNPVQLQQYLLETNADDKILWNIPVPGNYSLAATAYARAHAIDRRISGHPYTKHETKKHERNRKLRACGRHSRPKRMRHGQTDSPPPSLQRAAKGGKASQSASKLASSFARSCGSRGSNQRRLEKSQLPAWLVENAACQKYPTNFSESCLYGSKSGIEKYQGILHGNRLLSGPRALKAALRLKNFVKLETSYLSLDGVLTRPLLARL